MHKLKDGTFVIGHIARGRWAAAGAFNRLVRNTTYNNNYSEWL
jgi:hypothetical protein